MGNVYMEATQINYRGGGVKKSVEQAIKDATELTPEQKTNINKIPTIEAAVAMKADQAIIAPEFDSEAGVYAIGELVMYEGKLYEFTTAHETAGDWDSTEVTEKTIADELSSLESGLTNLNNKMVRGSVDVTAPADDFASEIINVPWNSTDYTVVITILYSSNYTNAIPAYQYKTANNVRIGFYNTGSSELTARLDYIIMLNS